MSPNVIILNIIIIILNNYTILVSLKTLGRILARKVVHSGRSSSVYCYLEPFQSLLSALDP